jgi:hypothetical protein
MLDQNIRFFSGRWQFVYGILVVVALVVPLPAFSQAAVAGRRQTIKVKVIDHEIVMPGYVNNSPKMNVVLDTGSSVSILMPERAAKLKLRSLTTASAGGLGKGQNETVHLISGVTLAWGIAERLSLRGQTIATLPIGYISQETGYPVSAIFGSSLFQSFRVQVNYEDSEVTFSSGDLPARSGTAVPIKLYDGVPYAEAAFETASGNKVPALFLIDSGTAGDLILNKNFLDAHPSIAKGHALVPIPATTAVGGAILMRALRITGLDLGPFHLAGPVAAVPDKALGALASHGIAGFIGAGILSRFTVDWNYRGHTMSLTPNRLYGAPFKADTSGLRLVAEGPSWRKIRVEAVAAASPAAVAGIRTGDIVEKINGAVPPPLYELTKLLSHAGTLVTVTVIRSGKQKTTTIHLRQLV